MNFRLSNGKNIKLNFVYVFFFETTFVLSTINSHTHMYTLTDAVCWVDGKGQGKINKDGLMKWVLSSCDINAYMNEGSVFFLLLLAIFSFCIVWFSLCLQVATFAPKHLLSFVNFDN